MWIMWEPEFSPENQVSVNKGRVHALKKAECIKENIKDVHKVQSDANKQAQRPSFTNSQR